MAEGMILLRHLDLSGLRRYGVGLFGRRRLPKLWSDGAGGDLKAYFNC